MRRHIPNGPTTDEARDAGQSSTVGPGRGPIGSDPKNIFTGTGQYVPSSPSMRRLGAQLLRAAETGNAQKAQALIDGGCLVNYRDPQTGETALHIAAASRARNVLRVLLKYKDCDFLMRDRQGRMASDLAFLFANDTAVARLLDIKERKQARAQGITLTRNPRQR